MDLKSILLVIHVLLAISLIGFILIQHGKGADAGAAFGSGASSTVFGARGSSSFLSRTTAYLATLFFVVSFTLYFLAVQEAEQAKKGAQPDQAPVTQPSPKKAPVKKGDSAPEPKGAEKRSPAKTDSSPAPKTKGESKPGAAKPQAGSKKAAEKKDSSPTPKQ